MTRTTARTSPLADSRPNSGRLTSLTNPREARDKGRVAGWIVGVAIALTGAACAAPVEDDLVSSGDELKQCSNAKASKLAGIAKRMDGKRSQKLCYRYVKSHLKAAGISVQDIEAKGYGASAYMFTTWARKNPGALAKMGLKKASVGLDDLPRGAVIVWPRGMCGYNATHGHIEIVVDDASSRACSDFCGRIRRGCGTPDVYLPTGCDSTPSKEADDTDEEDTSVKAPADEDDADADPDTTADTDPDPDEDTGGDCYSPTLGERVELHGCVQSRADKVWYQCKDGQWYRGVNGNVGRFGTCKSLHPLD